MKVLYSKFTRERVPEFQQETTIFMDDAGLKKVQKRALRKEGGRHIKNMYENYRKFTEKDCPYFLECEYDESGVIFPFVEGESLYEKMVAAVQKRDRQKFLEILDSYMKIVRSCLYEQVAFAPDEKFNRIFGDASELAGMPASRYLDVDLTFDNIIINQDDEIKIIDYEWIFDCPVPEKFAVYRAMFAFYLKHGGQLKGLITEEEYYQYAEITPKMRVCFAKMNDAMMDFIMGREQIKEQYLRDVRMFAEIHRENTAFSQIFLDTGNGYTEEESFVYPIGNTGLHKRIVLDLEKYPDLKSVRIDPLNMPCAIQIKELSLETDQGRCEVRINEMLTNAGDIYDGLFEFQGSDPQMILMNAENENWKRLTVDFQILYYKNNEGDIKISEEHISDILKNLHQQKEDIRLLKAKMKYIESTKAYGLLLKDKVNKVK